MVAKSSISELDDVRLERLGDLQVCPLVTPVALPRRAETFRR